jgi:hypothetical protein
MTTIGGIPAHILLVHAVVLVPLAALLTVLVTTWPAARARLTFPTAIVAAVAAICVPLTTSAGQWLEHRVASTALLRTHTALGDTLLPWAVGLAVVRGRHGRMRVACRLAGEAGGRRGRRAV